jgi:hypothetical protein
MTVRATIVASLRTPRGQLLLLLVIALAALTRRSWSSSPF